jgi:formate dehydrogenase major subunit
MKLIRTNGDNGFNAPSGRLAGLNPPMDRRNFLRAAGLGGLGAGLYAFSGPSLIKEAKAQGQAQPQPPKLDQYKTICTKCAVGCGLIGEVQNGVWVSQEPWFEHPINQGNLCSQGAAARSGVISEKRLRYPMKLAGGKWQRLSWDQALSEISTKMLDLRKKHGPDMLHINFSAHQSNENGYAIRKWAGMWGTNNADFQARI